MLYITVLLACRIRASSRLPAIAALLLFFGPGLHCNLIHQRKAVQIFASSLCPLLPTKKLTCRNWSQCTLVLAPLVTQHAYPLFLLLSLLLPLLLHVLVH